MAELVGPYYGTKSSSTLIDMFVSSKRNLHLSSLSVIPHAGHEIINELFNFRPTWIPVQQPAEMAVRYVDSSGMPRVKGGRDLKQSQSYPKGCFPQLSPHDVKHEGCYIMWVTR